MHLPVLACHSRAVQSADEVSINVPSRVNTAVFNQPVWPVKVRVIAWSSIRHSFAVMSAEAVTMCVPVGEKLAARM